MKKVLTVVFLAFFMGVVAFGVKIGSLLPGSLNEVLEGALGERVFKVSGSLETYDVIFSPFKIEGSWKRERAFGFVMLYFDRENDDRFVFPMDYYAFFSFIQASVRKTPEDLTSVVFPETTKKVFESLRRLHQDGKLLPFITKDPLKIFKYSIEHGLDAVLPSYFLYMFPDDYVPRTLREVFSLPYLPSVIWVDAYYKTRSGEVIVSRLLSKSIQEKLLLKGLILPTSFIQNDSLRGFLQAYRDPIFEECTQSCGCHAPSLGFNLFLTKKDIGKILSTLSDLIETMIWNTRYESPLYITLYVLIVVFILTTFLRKFNNYIVMVKRGLVEPRLTILLETYLLSLVSLVGVLSIFDEWLSKIFFSSLLVSLAASDYYLRKKRWWLPLVGFVWLFVGIRYDLALTVVDAPIMFSVLGYINEDKKGLKAGILSLGFLSFIVVKVGGHILYLPFVIVMIGLTWVHLIMDFLKLRRETPAIEGYRYTGFIIYAMMGLAFITVSYGLLTAFAKAYEASKNEVEQKDFEIVDSRLSNVSDPFNADVPVIIVENPLRVVDSNVKLDDFFKDYDSRDRTVFRELIGGRIAVSYVDYTKVLKKCFSMHEAYLISIGLIVVVFWLAASFVGLMNRRIASQLREAILTKERRATEYVKRTSKWAKTSALREKIFGEILKITAYTTFGANDTDFMITLGKVISGSLGFVQGFVVARLEGGKWRCVYPLRCEGATIETVPIPIPDLKLVHTGGSLRTTISASLGDGIYALVFSFKEGADVDMEIFETVKMVVDAYSERKNAVRDIVETGDSLVLVVSKLIDSKVPYSHNHSIAVAELSEFVAKKMEMNFRRIRMAGALHDIGKLLVPDEILFKEGPLTEEERDVIRKHPVLGYNILIQIPKFRDIALWIRHHHEKCDGSGYPDGLRCYEIPMESKIIAVANSLEAMTAERIYRKKKSYSEAFEELRQFAGKIYDKNVVDVVLDNANEVRHILESIRGETS